MSSLTAVAVSGGVDSLVTAFLLKNSGHNVVGIHFIHGYEGEMPGSPSVKGHPANESYRLADHISKIGDQTGISVEVVDCRESFQKHVVDYFVETYRIGRTPNPCMICNPRIKFGKILRLAEKLGADSLATGHYARRFRDEQGRYHLRRGIDRKKDQSYFLGFLNQDQLSAARFPLGEMTKSQVIAFAEEKGLKPLTQSESQDICFIRNRTYGEFLTSQKGFTPRPGLIEDSRGNVLGEHSGLNLFTVGQRRGINCPATEPYYVKSLDTARNRLVVGFKKELGTRTCRVVDVNWICPMPVEPVRVQTRVRYRSHAIPSLLTPTDKQKASIRFETVQTAITPGQAAVFYHQDEVLGAGLIELPDEAA